LRWRCAGFDDGGHERRESRRSPSALGRKLGATARVPRSRMVCDDASSAARSAHGRVCRIQMESTHAQGFSGMWRSSNAQYCVAKPGIGADAFSDFETMVSAEVGGWF
jgi:hypothetical protein